MFQRRERNGPCASCGHFAIFQGDRPVSADRSYRADGFSSLPGADSGRPWCNLQLETAYLDDAMMLSAERPARSRSRGVINMLPPYESADLAAVFARDRQCGNWVRWRPGKSLEGHQKMGSETLGLAAQVAVILAGILAAIDLLNRLR